MTLLDEVTTTDALRAMLATASQAKLAVAFWGRGAIETLGLDRPNLALEVLCNPDSGACNPDEMRLLLALPNVKLKRHPSLHAKIYWTPGAAVIGSSNASANGLVVEGGASGWRETNIQVEAPELVAQIKDRFSALFDDGEEVTPEAIELAARLWKLRKRLQPTGRPLARTLFEAFAVAPKHRAWKTVKLIYCRDDLDPPDEDWMALEIKKKRQPEYASAYAEWNERIAPGDQIIAYEHGGRAARWDGVWRAESCFAADARGMRIVLPVDGDRVSVGSLGSFVPTAEERAVMAGLKGAVMTACSTDGGRNAIIDFAKAMALLKTARPAADPTAAGDPKAFDRAMHQIYADAAAFKYYPNTFLRMLTSLGGVEAAKRLVRGNSTSGFARLWDEGRLDLSVEALIINPEWRGLFDQADLAAAHRRLKDTGYERHGSQDKP